MKKLSRIQSVIVHGTNFLKQPIFIIIAITLMLLSKVIWLGTLTYGDIPAFDVSRSKVNFLYAWGPMQLGTNVRQGFNMIRDELFLLLPGPNYLFYFLKYLLPILLIPFTYFWIFKKLGIRSHFVLVVASLAPLFTPIVFGDFLTGQTFWIYLTLPWVFFFTIRIFCLQRFTLRNYFLLAIFLFLSLGVLPPIVVPLLVTLVIMATVSFLLDVSLKWQQAIPQYLTAGMVVGIVFFLLSAPYLLVASSGQAAYTPASLLGDYYHNYSATNLLNTLRLAGNNGSGQNTLNYNIPTLSNILGYFLVAFVLVGSLWIGLKKRTSLYRTALVSLLVAMIALIGFMNVMSTNLIVGARVFQSQWVVSTIRNPSKLYAITLPIFSILLAFSLQNFMVYFAKSRWKRVISGIVAVSLIGLYGWPALRGDLGLLFHKNNQVAEYKTDPTDQGIARQVPITDRSLLIPANHRDELNYQYINPGFNILELEGGQPMTTKFVQQMRQSLNNQDSYFFNYLMASGVNNVFLKKDPKAYQQSLFDLFSVALSPEQSKKFLKSSLPLKKERKDYWRFSNPKANPLIFSPRSVINIQGAATLQTEAPFMDRHTAVITSETLTDNHANRRLVQYRAVNQLKNGATIASGKAQLHDPRLLLVDLYAQQSGAARYVNFDILNPITNEVQVTIKRPVGPNASVITLDGGRYTFSAEKKRITVRSGNYRLTSGYLQAIDIKNIDPSFEGNPPSLADATPKQPGGASFSTASNADAVRGKKSLLLSTKNHTGFIERDLPITDPTKDYLLTFQYKNLYGSAPSFTLLQGDKPLLFSGGKLNANGAWQTQEAYFNLRQTSNNKDQARVLFYTGPSHGQSNANLFDDMQLFTINKESTSSLDFPSYRSDYDLTNYRYEASKDLMPQNLLDNASFEDPSLWGNVGDSTAGSKGKAVISAGQSRDAEDGNFSLKLESKNHTAYVSKTASHYERNNVYKLSFYFKPISGDNASFAIWQDGANVALPSQKLKGQRNVWNYFETYFVPDQNATNLTLYLYASSFGEHTVDLYDNVSLHPTSLISTYLEKTNSGSADYTDLVAGYHRINPTAVSVDVRQGAGMVVFNESYQKGWKAFVVPAGSNNSSLSQKLMLHTPGQEIKDHVIVNGFANGWMVDSNQYRLTDTKGDYQILLLYMPQKLMYKGFAISGLTMVSLAVYFVYDARRYRNGDSEAQDEDS